MKFSLCALLLPTATTAFAPSSFDRTLPATTLALSKKTDNDDSTFMPFENGEFEASLEQKNHVPLSVAAVSALTALPSAASAAGPDWGLFEGRTGSLIHPTVMGSLFLYSAYTAYLGFQWRRQRTLGDEISALKATLPKVPTPVTSDGTEDEAAAAEAAKVAAVAAPIEKEIQALQQERKDIAASGPRDKHFSQGALLAFLGTSIAIEGCLNTYSRAGKLFPGPHLYAGAALVVMWGLAVATVPAMQKGNDTARTIHIGANVGSLAFFAWQVQSGIPILLKVWEKTSWP